MDSLGRSQNTIKTIKYTSLDVMDVELQFQGEASHLHLEQRFLINIKKFTSYLLLSAPMTQIINLRNSRHIENLKNNQFDLLGSSHYTISALYKKQSFKVRLVNCILKWVNSYFGGRHFSAEVRNKANSAQL